YTSQQGISSGRSRGRDRRARLQEQYRKPGRGGVAMHERLLHAAQGAEHRPGRRGGDTVEHGRAQPARLAAFGKPQPATSQLDVRVASVDLSRDGLPSECMRLVFVSAWPHRSESRVAKLRRAISTAGMSNVGHRWNDLVAHHLNRPYVVDADHPAEYRLDAQRAERTQPTEQLRYFGAIG